VTRNGQRLDSDGEKEKQKQKQKEKMEKTLKRGRNHSAMEEIEVEGID
jgi:hypothetical protein